MRSLRWGFRRCSCRGPKRNLPMGRSVRFPVSEAIRSFSRFLCRSSGQLRRAAAGCVRQWLGLSSAVWMRLERCWRPAHCHQKSTSAEKLVCPVAAGILAGRVGTIANPSNWTGRRRLKRPRMRWGWWSVWSRERAGEFWLIVASVWCMIRTYA